MRLESGVMSQGAWDYLAMHKFGSVGFTIHFSVPEILKMNRLPPSVSWKVGSLTALPAGSYFW